VTGERDFPIGLLRLRGQPDGMVRNPGRRGRWDLMPPLPPLIRDALRGDRTAVYQCGMRSAGRSGRHCRRGLGFPSLVVIVILQRSSRRFAQKRHVSLHDPDLLQANTLGANPTLKEV
jgi:hypothetical protein